jgi:hypothetical protein
VLETPLDQMISRKIRYRSLIAEKIWDPRLGRVPTIAAAKTHNRKSGARNCLGHTGIIEVSQYAVTVPGSKVWQSLALEGVFFNIDVEVSTLLHITGNPAYDFEIVG